MIKYECFRQQGQIKEVVNYFAFQVPIESSYLIWDSPELCEVIWTIFEKRKLIATGFKEN